MMRDSFRARIGLASVLGLLIFGLSVIAFFFWRESNYRMEAVHSEIRKSAGFLIPQAYLILKRDDPGLRLDFTQVAQAIVARGDFCFVEVIDAEGNLKVPLSSMGSPPHGRFIRQGPWGTLAVGRDHIIREEEYEGIGPVLEGIFGIVERDRILGYIVLGAGIGPIRSALWKNIGAAAAVFLVLLILASYLSWRFAQSTAQPVLSLAEAVEGYDGSSGLERFDMEGPREVRILASAIRRQLTELGRQERTMKQTIEFQTESLRKSQQEIKTILDSFRKLSKHLKMEDVASSILDLARSVVYCNVAHVILLPAEAGSGGALFSADGEGAASAQGGVPLLDAELVERVLDKRDVEIILDARSSPFRPQVHSGIRSCAVYPLVSGMGRRFGVLLVGMRGDAPLDERELAVLRVALEPVGMVLDNVSLYSQVENLATHDSMTGLLNHQNVREKLMESLKIARRQNHSVFVLMADIDKFKMFNDTYGHPAGDKVIKAFAKILQGSRRVGEYTGRPGGEEFIVILGNSTLEGACAAAERILAEVRACRVGVGADEPVGFRVSMGIAGSPDHAETMDELLEKADIALYGAKAAGRDRCVVWSEAAGFKSKPAPRNMTVL